jgi:RNA-directed DNA polymerase
MSQGLDGVRKAARERRQERFTALLHDLNVDLLRDRFYALKRQASPESTFRRLTGGSVCLGIMVLEDKIVQHAVVTILNQIYEVDFKGFSYGFRPSRSPHQALDALAVGLERKKVNWVLDADIRGFFR